jgi:tRNA (cytidine/uridine-2'-O-)-methyltransferase
MDYSIGCRSAASWPVFEVWRRRRVATDPFTTTAALSYLDHGTARDVLMFTGNPRGPGCRARADARLLIPMRPELRSINVAMVAAMALGEAMRQTNGLPNE